jgi:DNA-binding LacI/PurR family transcriptional regulator
MAINVHAVAKAAGVSASTVSRVFNNNPDIAAETAERVRREAERLGYKRTSTRGRPANWKTKRTGNIAVLVPDVQQEALRTPLMGRLLEGADLALRTQHLNLLLAGLGVGEALPPCLEPPQVDGMLIRMLRIGSSLPAFEARLPDLPRVWMLEPETTPAAGDIVHADNEAVASRALRYLVDKGCRRMIVYQALPKHHASRDRAEAFVRAAPNAAAEAVACGGLTEVLQLYRKLTRANVGAVGFFLPLGDDHTESIYRALVDAGLFRRSRTPIVSCNNDPARLAALDPHLPNIDIRGEEIGKAAAELLLWRIQNPKEPQRRVLIVPTLVAQ